MKKIIINDEEYTLNEAKKAVLAQAAELDLPEDFCQLLNEVVKVPIAKKRPESKQSQFRKLFEENDKVSEDELWEKFRWGNHEVLSAAWYLRKEKNTKPEDFIWIKAEKIDGNKFYVVKGRGPEMPEGYDKKKSEQ